MYHDLMSNEPSPIDWDNCPYIKIGTFPFEFSAPSRYEILSVFKKCNKRSSPGMDNLTYSDILYFDPEARILEKLFATYMALAKIPNSWRSSRTILIPKSGNLDLSLAANWRPIALLNSAYKIFTSCLTNQLLYWIGDENLLHRNQKSIALYEGCVEHNFALNMTIERHYREKLSTHIVFLDIANAFPSIPIETILGILHRHNTSNQNLEIINQLYQNCDTTICLKDMNVGPLKVKKGVRQGCPLSMLLFNIAINQVLLAVDPSQNTNTPAQAFKILAYADDLAIMGTDINQLQNDVDKATKAIEWCGMKVKPTKCAQLTMSPAIRHGKTANNQPFKNIIINNHPIPVVEGEQKFKYLGILRGKDIHQNPHDIYAKYIDKMRKLTMSALHPWHVLDAFKTFIQPKLIFFF